MNSDEQKYRVTYVVTLGRVTKSFDVTVPAANPDDACVKAKPRILNKVTFGDEEIRGGDYRITSCVPAARGGKAVRV